MWVKTYFRRTVGENHALWSDRLDDALWAFRTAFKTPIGCTPYKLVYGKPCHLPIELEHRAYWALKHANFDLKTAGDHRKLQLNELNELRDQAYENSLIYKERTKKLHDSKIKNRIFNVGDQVLLFNSRLKIFSGKLKTRWTLVFGVFVRGFLSFPPHPLVLLCAGCGWLLGGAGVGVEGRVEGRWGSWASGGGVVRVEGLDCSGEFSEHRFIVECALEVSWEGGADVEHVGVIPIIAQFEERFDGVFAVKESTIG
ncbi:reverse transcriptase domain-containing protein [Tanacetum coccineum]